MRAVAEEVASPHAFAHVAKYFEAGRKDNEWIPAIASEGNWIVISSDRGRRANDGGKLPALCVQYKVTHVLLSAKLHAKSSQIKRAAFVLVWPQIVATHSAVPGSRFILRYKQFAETGVLTLALQKIELPQDSAST